jgi:sugar phosphate isomerase/epimerase
MEGLYHILPNLKGMQLSLCGAGLGAGQLSLLEFAELAARSGYAGIDFGISSAQRLADALGGVGALCEKLRTLGVAPASFGLEVEWRRDDAAFQSGLETLAERAALAQQLGCTRCCTWMPSSTSDDSSLWRTRTVARFAEIGKVFADYGVRLGLEWVGPHHLRAGGENQMGPNPTVWTLPQTLELIAETGLGNIGLLVDSYHCYTTGITEAELAALTDSQIVHVHINDAPKGVGPAGAKDGQRVLPGTGEIDLVRFLNGLRRAGYSGSIACEILAPAPVAETPDEAAVLIRAALRGLGL